MTKTQKYFRNLDALRSLCFLMVFFFHSFTTKNESVYTSYNYRFIKQDIFGNGNLGVTFFFVLSGFLITFLLAQEKIDTGKINIISFWIRRVLRIWPLYFTCLFIGFVIFPFAKQLMGVPYDETANLSAYLYFGGNFDFIHNGRPDASILGVLWSISVEEQYYLFWPLILILFQIKHWWIPILTIIAISLAFRIQYTDYLNREFNTLSCMNDLAIGSLFGWLFAYSISFKKSKLFKWLWINYFLFILLYFFKDELEKFNAFDVLSKLIIAIIIVGIILHQANERSKIQLYNWKLLSKLGKYTYGLYSLHFLGILITVTITQHILKLDNVWSVFIIDTVISLLCSILLAYLSYSYLEKPFLKMKKRFS